MSEGEFKKKFFDISIVSTRNGVLAVSSRYTEIEKVLDEAKAEIAHAIYSGTDLELREVLRKWFGRFDSK